MISKTIQDLINLYGSGKLDIVEKKVTEEIKKNPKNFVLYNLYGAILADKKNFDKAILNYKKSLEINPNYAEGHNNLGITFFKLGKFIRYSWKQLLSQNWRRKLDLTNKGWLTMVYTSSFR